MRLFQITRASYGRCSGDGDTFGSNTCQWVNIVQSRIATPLGDGDVDLALMHHRHVARGLSGSDIESVGQSRDIRVLLRLHINDGIVAGSTRRGCRLIIVEFQEKLAVCDGPHATELTSA